MNAIAMRSLKSDGFTSLREPVSVPVAAGGRHELSGRIVAAVLVAGLAWVSEAPAQRGADAVLRVRKLDPSLPGPTTRSRADLNDLNGGQHSGDRADRPAILLTGYWPPSNEAIRRWSPSPTQNPQGWIGSDWEGRGYDVYSYFPEFNPANCNFCGKGSGDLEVDYQDTSADFWPIANGIEPIAVITFSRGFPDLSWELEMNQYNRSQWIDDYLSPFQPTPSPPDGSVPAGTLRLSALPVQDIVDAVNNANLGVNAYICYSGDGGGFLSEFIAYHGVWYQNLHPSPTDSSWCIAGGHVHVGGSISWSTARLAAEVSLRTLIGYVDAVRAATICQVDLGYGGPGTATLKVCGDPLGPGGEADLLFSGAPAGVPAWMLAGLSFSPTYFHGGFVVPLPPSFIVGFICDLDGEWFVPRLPGGGGPATIYLQTIYRDPFLAEGVGFSNVVGIDLLQ